jgi:hypothetical protein
MKKLAILLSAAALVFSFFIRGDSSSVAQRAKEETSAQNEEIRPEITTQLDKDFGYFVGDIVAVRYKIKMPPESHWRISLKDLPKAGETVGKEVEIREIKTRRSGEGGRAVVTLEVKFQIFRVFNQPRNLSTPAIAFFYGPEENPRQMKGVLPQVPVKISPLCGEDEPMLQPFFEPSVRSIQKSLALTLGGGILMIAGWLWFLKVFICLFRHPSPFKEAIGKIKKIEPENFREILLIFRHSLNRRLGQAVFKDNLDKFFRIIPRARKRAEEISKIIELCDNLHFNPNFQPDPQALFGLKNRLISELKHLLRSERWK